MEGRRTPEEIKNDVDAVINARLKDSEVAAQNRPALSELYNNQQFKTALANKANTAPNLENEDDSKAAILAILMSIEEARDMDALLNTEILTTDENDQQTRSHDRVKFYWDKNRLTALSAENAKALTAAPAADSKPEPTETRPRSSSTDSLRVRPTHLPSPQPTPTPVASAPAASAAAAPEPVVVPAPKAAIDEDKIREAIELIKDGVDLKALLNANTKKILPKLKDNESYQELLQKTTQLYDQDKLAEYLDKTLGITGVDENTLKTIVEKNIGLELDRMQKLRDAKVSAAIDAVNAIGDKDTQAIVQALLAEAGDKAVAKFQALNDIVGGKSAAQQAEDLVNAVADSVGKATLTQPLDVRTKKLNGALMIESLKAIGLNPTLNNTALLAQLETNQDTLLEEVKKVQLTDFAANAAASWIKNVFSSMSAAQNHKNTFPANSQQRLMFLLPNDYDEYMANIPDQMKTVNALHTATSNGVGAINDPVELEKISYEIYRMQTRLEVFRKNCELRKKHCSQGVYPSAEKKADNALPKIESMLKTLEDAQNNLKFARQLNQAGKTKVGYLGDKAQVFKGATKDTDVAQFIQSYLGEPANNGNGALRIGGERLKTKEKLNSNDETHVIATTLKTRIFGSPIATVAVQTKSGDAKNGYHYRQDIHAGQGLSGRRGFPFRRLPEDYVIEMAIVQVDNFLAALKDDKDAQSKPIILETGNLDKSCIEALQVVCKIRKVHYIIQGSDPFKNDQDRLSKMIDRVREKDKSSQRFGGKLLSGDEHAEVVQSSIPRQRR